MASPGWGTPNRGCFVHSAKGPVSRILYLCGHSSRRRVTAALISDLPGGFGNCLSRLAASGRCAAAAWLLAAASLPIWSCSVWGLPCPRHYWRSGALLPHHFTLTPAPGAVAKPTSANRPGSPSGTRGGRGGIFSVALAVREPSSSRPGRYPAHCPAEFGLSSPGMRASACRQRPPGPPATLILPRFRFLHPPPPSLGLKETITRVPPHNPRVPLALYSRHRGSGHGQ